MNPKETTQQLMLSIDMVEREKANEIAKREVELIEHRSESQRNKGKWRVIEE